MKDGVHPEGYEIKRKQTNADRIRSMTDEELAEFLGGIDHTIDDCEFIVKIGDEWLHDSTADILDWLQSEVKGVTENELS